MKTGKFIKTDGEALEAEIEYNGRIYKVMDNISVCGQPGPKQGQLIRFEFYAGICGDEDWDTIFRGNPDEWAGLEHLSGWRYKAYGRIISVNPVIVDCGVLKVEDVVRTRDERVIGEYIAFTIERLDILVPDECGDY